MTADGYTILLVEDDKHLAFVIRDNLEQEGYRVFHESDGKAAVARFREEGADLVLLDIMLPKQDGFSVAAEIRVADPEVPLIFLTAKDFQEDRIKGLRLGADDYVTKPFVLEELLLRISAVLRRYSAIERPEDGRLEFGKFSLDPASLDLRIGDESHTLTRKEAALLAELARHKGRVVERSRLLKKVWGEDGYFVGRSMDVYMTRIRKYLKADPEVALTNIHGVGFKLTDKEDDLK